MGVIFTQIQELFGEKLDNITIKEALTYPDNKRLAKIGDTVLDLVNHTTSYHEKLTPEMMAQYKELNYSQSNHTRLLNEDQELVRYLLENDYDEYTIENIGEDRADAYLEAILGAIYVTFRTEKSYRFVEQVYT
jgi:dsRNA-specific ribonuclease